MKKSKEKQGLFEDIPEWQRLFQDMDKHIRLFDAYRWNAYTTKENLTKKRDEMLKMVKSLDNIDLHVLYYTNSGRQFLLISDPSGMPKSRVHPQWAV